MRPHGRSAVWQQGLGEIRGLAVFALGSARRDVHLVKMNAKQAQTHNTMSPFTVAPCDNTRAFEMRSFTTEQLARDYAAQTGGRPWVIALPSGALVAFG